MGGCIEWFSNTVQQLGGKVSRTQISRIFFLTREGICGVGSYWGVNDENALWRRNCHQHAPPQTQSSWFLYLDGISWGVIFGRENQPPATESAYVPNAIMNSKHLNFTILKQKSSRSPLFCTRNIKLIV